MRHTLWARVFILVVFAVIIIPAWLPPVGLAQPHSGYPITSYLRCTRDPVLVQALQRMDETDASHEALRWIIDQPVRVVFKDMKVLAKGLENYDALSWISAQGEQVIFVNEKHRNAPPEALAAMLSHEALHNDIYNSTSEEIAGWRQEALVWQEMKVLNPALVNIPAGALFLVDRENKIEQEYQRGTLDVFVKGNAGYRNLPKHSPGFGPPRTAAVSSTPQSF